MGAPRSAVYQTKAIFQVQQRLPMGLGVTLLSATPNMTDQPRLLSTVKTLQMRGNHFQGFHGSIAINGVAVAEFEEEDGVNQRVE